MSVGIESRSGEDSRPPLRVLSLDGGGILGAFTAGVLDGLMTRANQEEQRAARAEGREPKRAQLLDHVDLITGTSTGGIIAIALAMGSTPEEICTFYTKHGKTIFPRDPLKIRTTLHLLWYKYRPTGLRSAIESVVGTRRLSEAGCGLVIPAVDVDLGAIRLFKTDHFPQAQWATQDVSAVDVALATSAAPTYFPAHTIPGSVTYIDGGLWANCPAMVGLTEAVAHLGYDLDEIRLLSISTTSVPYHLDRANRIGGLVRWAKPVIRALMRFQVEGSHSMAKSMLTMRGGKYHRIDHVAPEDVFSMDDARMVHALIGMGRNIGSFQTNYKFFREHFLSGPPATLHRRPAPASAP